MFDLNLQDDDILDDTLAPDESDLSDPENAEDIEDSDDESYDGYLDDIDDIAELDEEEEEGEAESQEEQEVNEEPEQKPSKESKDERKPAKQQHYKLYDSEGNPAEVENIDNIRIELNVNNNKVRMNIGQLVSTLQAAIPEQIRANKLTREIKKVEMLNEAIREEKEELIADLLELIDGNVDDDKRLELSSKYLSYFDKEAREGKEHMRTQKVQQRAETLAEMDEMLEQSKAIVQDGTLLVNYVAERAIDSEDLPYINEDNIKDIVDTYAQTLAKEVENLVSGYKKEVGDSVDEQYLYAYAWKQLGDKAFSTESLAQYFMTVNNQFAKMQVKKDKVVPKQPAIVPKANAKTERKLSREGQLRPASQTPAKLPKNEEFEYAGKTAEQIIRLRTKARLAQLKNKR